MPKRNRSARQSRPIVVSILDRREMGNTFSRGRQYCFPPNSGNAVHMDQTLLEREAMRLSAKDRALSADVLLGSLDDDAAPEVEVSRTGEAEERLTAYRRGDLEAVDGPAALRELRGQQKQ